MKDFFKIFLILCAMVGAFFVGKGYGEQTFFASEDYKNIAKTREELDYARGDIENTKAKLQNIIDNAGKQKTDELLAQILQVFLADLGLQIQNRDLILEQAKKSLTTESVNHVEKAKLKASPEDGNAKVNSENETSVPPASESVKEASKEVKRDRQIGQLTSNEWMLLNSDFDKKLLKKVTLKNYKRYFSNASPELNDCNAFIGLFKGSLKGEDGSNQGSLSFELRNDRDAIEGRIAWMNSPNPQIATNISGNCGLRADPLMARFFTLSDSLSLQVYPISNSSELIGNLYEKLPAGTVKKVGTFRIRRITI